MSGLLFKTLDLQELKGFNFNKFAISTEYWCPVTCGIKTQDRGCSGGVADGRREPYSEHRDGGCSPRAAN